MNFKKLKYYFLRGILSSAVKKQLQIWCVDQGKKKNKIHANSRVEQVNEMV